MGGPARLVADLADGATDSVAGDILVETQHLIEALEQRYSRYRATSLISRINRRAGSGEFTDIDSETMALLRLAGQLWSASGGLFDVTSGPLRWAWDFQSAGASRPEHIESACSLIGWELIEWEGCSMHLPVRGMEIDFGGIAKEYAVDCATKRMRDAGVKSGMVELAGDVGVIGNQANGHPWQIGIRKPYSEVAMCTVNLTDSAVATSGSYARRLQHGDNDYGHLLDPRSGWPTEGPVSVTVIDAHCLTAGAVATVACLQSESMAIEWLEKANLPWLMVDQQAKTSGPVAYQLATCT